MNFKEFSDETNFSSLFTTFVFTNEHEIHDKGAQRVCSSGLWPAVDWSVVCLFVLKGEGSKAFVKRGQKLKLSYICKR